MNKLDSNQNYLIIAGTSKAATTSIFDYFANHPQICASSVKETRFFLDKNYPLPSEFRYEDGIHKYLDYFVCQNSEMLRLEASPDYLYSTKTARKIKDTLPNVHFIFILREPIARLISWFKFGKLMRKIPKQMTFEEYIDCQLHKAGYSQKLYQHPAFYALEQGRYSKYLKSYVDLFYKENIHICFYEDFVVNPALFMKNICKFINIDEDIFNNYEFKSTNKSSNMRSTLLHNLLYFKIISRLRNFVYDKNKLRSIFKQIRYRLEPIYFKLNEKSTEDIIISKPTINYLNQYYEDEVFRLTTMFGIRPPW